MLEIKNRQNAYTSKQMPLLCVNVDTNQSSQLQVLGNLAASTNVADPLYYTGTLLAKYGTNAPSPDLVGFYVNFDPTSTNPDQAVCVGAISGEFVNGVTGAVNTTPDANANTLNRVNVIEFSIGTTYYPIVLAEANDIATMTAFYAAYKIKQMASVYYNDTLTTVESIQGVI